MFKGIMKRIFLTLLVLTCLTSISLAANISDIRTRQIEDGIYNLLYIRQQIQAVDNDMILYFGWMPEEKQGMKDTAQQSIQELSRLRAKLMSVGMPPELTSVKNELMDVLEKQKNIYRGVETKTDEQIRASYVDFQKIIDSQIEHVGQKLDDYLTAQRMPDNFSVIQEELKLFADLKDQALFKQATDLLESKQIKPSYEILTKLEEKYKNTPMEGSILMKLSDCILNFDSDLPDEVASQEIGLNLLNQILDKRVYYPILYDAFHRWRTTEQSYNYGMSNYSEIPNLEYNDKRMDIVKVIQQHLISHPDDNWAKIQIIALLTLENIVRGEQYGNSNLRHTAVLYMNLDELNENSEAKEEKVEVADVPKK